MPSRFDDYIVDDSAECANCSAVHPYSVMLFDEHAEHYYCDRACFDEWHDANLLRVGDYYYDINVG